VRGVPPLARVLATLLGTTVSALIVAASAGTAAPTGDPEAGRRAFQVCGACHAVVPGAPTVVGPNLHGIVGRSVASAPGFEYSARLNAAGGTWDAARLERFLANPGELSAGTPMAAIAVASAQERADVVAYLATLSGDAPAMPPPPAPDFGADWPTGETAAETGALCIGCHSLAIVRQQRLPRSRWDRLLDWMVESGGMAPMSPTQRERVLDFLVTHYGPPPT